MQVKVYAPPFLDHTGLNSKGMMELNDGATLLDVYKKLRVPIIIRSLLFCRVNYEKASLNQILSNGDTVSIYFPITGG